MLYMKSRDESLDNETILIRYRENIDKSYQVYLYTLWVFTKILEQVLLDAETRANKLLPTEEDKKFSTILADNELSQSLLNNHSFVFHLKKMGFSHNPDAGSLKSIYKEFLKDESYQAYTQKSNLEHKDHKDMIVHFFKFCIKNETFEDIIVDEHLLWQDDKSLVVGAIKKTLKSLPLKDDFYLGFVPQEETVKEFGEALLKDVVSKDKEYLEILTPNLRNWEPDRVAIIDMIIIKMAISEFLNFPTIPTKVTLNEFVDIAKLYSTDKSKDFINGILDRLVKDLEKAGKINKHGRGLVSS